jgi:cyclophilin family peptidyl-prolyl cis-trans isomerase
MNARVFISPADDRIKIAESAPCSCREFLALVSSNFDPYDCLLSKRVSPGTQFQGLEVTPADDGGCDEKMFDQLLLAADFGRSRLFSGRERNTRILHCAEFSDEELHRR